MNQHIIDAQQIDEQLAKHTKEEPHRIHDILAKAIAMRGLDCDEVTALTTIQDPELLQQLFNTARQVKDEIYGKRLVLFAPLYISNLCSNECAYCAFRQDNNLVKRRALTAAEITQETTSLINQGHKRILLVAGEAADKKFLNYVLNAIANIYNTKTNHGEIRRINVNIAPLTVDEFKCLKAAEIGTYQLFQETYHPKIYSEVHLAGKKADYDWRITAIDRAMQAGIDDVGIGALFGLSDWRFDLLGLMQHSQHLEKHFGVGPHTISVPRLEPASGSEISEHPPHLVNDIDFCKLIAILRLAIPYTGIILSTRETAETRRQSLALGVSQISAGSRTNPGGYTEADAVASQFSLGDHRNLDEVVRDVASLGYVPSFCTACYRLERTGGDFMDLAKPGEIKKHCLPNGLFTFQEYLNDYASSATRKVGEQLIANELKTVDSSQRELVEALLKQVRNGKHDIFL